MPDKVVSIELRAKVDGAVAGFKKAKASVDDLTKAASPSKADAFGKLADKAALAGVGVATAVGVAVKRFADFDQAMSAVKANSGATGAEFDKLRGLAIKLGADSQFSAKEAADGINELAKAGVKTSDIIGGGLKGALDLAAAGQIGVAQAAETTASALGQFGLTGDKAGHVADLLANAANAAQGGVGDMGQALSQAGVAANAAGLDIDETTTLLALFAKAGMTGSDAGTSLKTMMQRLSAPTEAAKTALDELGVSAYDAQGNFVGAESVVKQLSESTAGYSTEAKMAAFNTIFGSDAIRAASIVAAAGADGYRKMNEEVTKFGGAQKNAAALTDNLKGDIERLGGALDSVFIQTGSEANGSLRSLVQGLTGLVDRVGKIPGPLLLAGGSLTAFALLAPKGVKMYREYRATMDSLGLSLDKISTKAPRTGKALDVASSAAKKAGIAFVAAAAASNFGTGKGTVGVDSLTKKLLESSDAAKALAGTWSEAAVRAQGFDSPIRSLGDALDVSLNPSKLQQIDDAGGKMFAAFGGQNLSDVEFAKQRLSELDQVLTGLVSAGQTEKAAALFSQFSREAAKSGHSVDQLKGSLPQYAESLAAASNAASAAVDPTTGLTDATGGLQEKTDAARQAQIDLAQAVVDAANAMIAASDSDVALAQANVDLAKTAETLRGATNKTRTEFDLSKESGRKAQSALNDYAGTARKAAEDNLKAGDSTAKVDGAMQKARATFIENATRLGISAKAANQMADEYGLSTQGVIDLKGSLDKLPDHKGVNVDVKTTGLTDLQRAGQYLKDIHDKHVTLTVGTVKVGNTRTNAGQFDGADGGYTGDGGKYEVAGIVHKGEYVITKAATASIGKATLAYLNSHGRLPAGYAEGGYVGSRRAPASLAPQIVRVPVGAGAPVVNQDIRTDDPARAAAIAVAGITWAMRTP